MELNSNILFMVGPNVIESEEHILYMAKKLKDIFNKFPKIQFVFKASFDKANRTSYNSYRGLGMEKGLEILKKVKTLYNLPIITDVHEPYQCEIVAKIVDIIQIPAFLCRQTDLIKAAAKTNKIIHVKKGQFLNAKSMLKVVEKLRKFGHTNKIILCERGSMYGYNDLIVDARNLIWMKSSDNLVSMDITHCLQQPAQQHKNGIIKAGGLREFIPLMSKIAIVSGVDAIFMEVHDNPEKAKCDGPTQWPLNKLEELLENIVYLYNCLKSKIGLIEQNESYNNMKEKCIICKNILDNYIIKHTNIRGDEKKICKIVDCNICNHRQLIGFRENLKEHYDLDKQTADIIKNFNISLQGIVNKGKIEINRRIKILSDININFNNNIICDIGAGYLTFCSVIKNKFPNSELWALEPSKMRIDLGKSINNINDDIIIYNEYLDKNISLTLKNKFDIVTLWHVLEHIDSEYIDDLIYNLISICKKGGKIIIEVPNRKDELFKIEEYANINYMIHHLSYFSKESFEKLFNRLNISNYKIYYTQRYGFKNYLNWLNKIDLKLNTNMYDVNIKNEHIDFWIKSKKQKENTDAIMVIINNF